MVLKLIRGLSRILQIPFAMPKWRLFNCFSYKSIFFNFWIIVELVFCGSMWDTFIGADVVVVVVVCRILIEKCNLSKFFVLQITTKNKLSIKVELRTLVRSLGLLLKD